MDAHTPPMTNDTVTQPSAIRSAPVDPRPLFATAVALGGSVIGDVRPEQLTAPTVCGQFDVRALLDHLVEVLHRVAAIGREDDPFAFASSPDVADDGWPAAWSDAARSAGASWADDAALDRIVQLLWATMPGAATLVSYVSEITVHTWDLAEATGQGPAWDDAVVAAAYEASRRALPATGRAAMMDAVRERLPLEWRDSPPPYGEAVDVPADAPLIDRLVAWNGRRP